MKRNQNRTASNKALEILEDRRLMSSVTFQDGVLTLQGNGNTSTDTFMIRAVGGDRILAVADNYGRVAPIEAIRQIVIKTNNGTQTIRVGRHVSAPVEFITTDGKTSTVAANQTVTLAGGSATNNGPATQPTGPSTSDKDNSQQNNNNGGAVINPQPVTSGDPVTPIVTPPVVTPPVVTPPVVTPPVATPPPASPTAPAPVITFTSSTSLLPGQSVFAQATTSNFGTGSVVSDQIQWDFGDPNSAHNQLTGFNAAHLYQNAGTYTVTLTITAPDGQVGTVTQQITVGADTRPTIYVAANGNDANDGTSASDPIQSLSRLSQLLTSNMRVLFNSGDTFNETAPSQLNLNGLRNVYVGSYGSGAKPTIMYTGPKVQGAMIGLTNQSHGITVQGLKLDSIYADNWDESAIISGFFPAGTDIVIADNTFGNLLHDMNMNSSPSDVLVQDNSSPDPTELNAYFAWVQGNDIVIVGNSVANSIGESLIRVGGANRVLIADNDLANIGGTGPNDMVKGSIAVQEGTYAYVYANTITSGGIGMGPIGSLSAPTTNSFQYGVFDSNVTHNITIAFQPGAHDVTARNNVVYQSGNSGFLINAQQISTNVNGQINWQAQNITFVHNTVIDSGAMGSFLTVANGTALNITMDNNLFVDPNYQTGSGQGLVQVDNNDLSSFSEIKNNVWAVPTTSNWAQGGYFYVNLHGGVQSGYLTPAEWSAMGLPQGDVYENVTLSGTYSVTANGFVAGSTLPMAA